jgi:hypothetical protein
MKSKPSFVIFGKLDRNLPEGGHTAGPPKTQWYVPYTSDLLDSKVGQIQIFRYKKDLRHNQQSNQGNQVSKLTNQSPTDRILNERMLYIKLLNKFPTVMKSEVKHRHHHSPSLNSILHEIQCN